MSDGTSIMAKGTVNRKKGIGIRSRNGCLICRARKIKCDESRPDCNKCKERNTECIWQKRYKKHDSLKPKAALDDHTVSQNILANLSSIFTIPNKSISSSENQSEDDSHEVFSMITSPYIPSPVKPCSSSYYLQTFATVNLVYMSSIGDQIDSVPWMVKLIPPLIQKSNTLTHVLSAYAAMQLGHKIEAFKHYNLGLRNLRSKLESSLSEYQDLWFACLMLADFEARLNNIVRCMMHVNGAIMMANARRRLVGVPLRINSILDKNLHDITHAYRTRIGQLCLTLGMQEPVDFEPNNEYCVKPGPIDSVDGMAGAVRASWQTLYELHLERAKGGSRQQQLLDELQKHISISDTLIEINPYAQRVSGPSAHLSYTSRFGGIERYNNIAGTISAFMLESFKLFTSSWPDDIVITRIMNIFAGIRDYFPEMTYVAINSIVPAALFVDLPADRDWVKQRVAELYVDNNYESMIVGAEGVCRVLDTCWQELDKTRAMDVEVSTSYVFQIYLSNWSKEFNN